MPVALVTGAGSGLGAEFARQLAGSAYDVVLVARSTSRLATVAAELRDRYGARAEVLAADLGSVSGLTLVEERLVRDGDPVDFLVNNAGFGVERPFVSSAVADEDAMLAVNVHAVMRLTKAAVGPMIDRGHGDILNVASVAAYVPNETGASYAASKAYVTALTESLAVTVRGTGVHLSVVCPGFVHTAFHERIGMDTAWIPPVAWLHAPDVVRAALADHRAGRVRSVPSVRYKAVVAVARLLPGPVLRAVIAKGRRAVESR